MFSAMTEWQLWHRAAHASTASIAVRATGLTEEPVVRGSSTTISVNRPGAESTRMVPLCWRMMSLVMVKLRPVPRSVGVVVDVGGAHWGLS